jgi:indolepyruvate ferredoxin oxidoreductase
MSMQATPRSAPAPAALDLGLDDRYLQVEGRVYLSGMQALVRLPIDQSRRDRRADLRIGTFISGYPGSPLGGYDLALRQARAILAQHDIRHVPGANEELAATALSGTQMLDRYPHSRYDGVVGLWYGKGPGVDRSGDALKHGNFAGTSRHGAVVVLSGDDHEAKSSTMPYQDDYAFVGHGMPILYPASTGEFLTLGLHAIALSRFSGCWVAMKLVGQLADGGETVHVSPDEPGIVVPELLIDGKPFRKSTDFTFFPGLNIETERQLYYERHRAVVAYARANSLVRAEVGGPSDRLGLVTAGKSYADVRQALLDLGLDDQARRRLGVRLLRVGLIYPLDAEAVRAFARDLEEIVVIEKRRAFLEAQVKEALAGLRQGVQVLGKADEVARLHLKTAFHTGTRRLFTAPRRLVWHLHPPLLRALGLRRKLRLGPWFRHALRALRALRRLRGTPFDPFGYAAVRREERRLVPWYRELVMGALAEPDVGDHAAAVGLARLPEAIRGYEEIKLRSIAAVRADAETRRAAGVVSPIQRPGR